MNRIVLIDGVEATGKSFLVNKLREEHPEWSFVKCPSDSLISKNFYEMISDDTRLLEIFVDGLIAEVREEFGAKKNTTLVFDRGFLSTLVYQGKNKEIVKRIWMKYAELFRELDVNFEDSCAILMLEPITGKTRGEKIPEKARIGAGLDVRNRFVKFATDERMPMSFYYFEYNTRFVAWPALNDIAGEILEIACD
jgi:thymidylate kinase